MSDEEKAKITDFDTRLKGLMQECAVEITTAITFPRYNIRPSDVDNEIKFALYLLDKHGATIVPRYKLKEVKQNDNT